MNTELKYLGGKITGVEMKERNGVKVGILTGHLAAWSIDRGDSWGVKDQFVKGAFIDSINDYKMRNRQIRLNDSHARVVGGFPIDNVYEDSKGLYVEGEVNMEVQQGRELYLLAKQGVMSDFSIEFSVDKFTKDEVTGIRTITKASLWGGAVVSEPMNKDTNILQVKSMADFADLPIADKGAEWDETKAAERVNKFINESEKSSDLTSKAFINVAAGESIAITNTLIADVINNELVAIPKAVHSAAKYIESLDGGIKSNAIYHLERYLAKMVVESPFTGNDKKYHTLDNAKDFDVRTLEKSLIKTGAYSKKAAKFLASKMKFDKPAKIDQNLNIDNKQNILNELISLKKLISK